MCIVRSWGHEGHSGGGGGVAVVNGRHKERNGKTHEYMRGVVGIGMHGGHMRGSLG